MQRNARGKFMLLPIVIYFFLGTTLLFLIYKIEHLSEKMARYSRFPAINGFIATEWHKRNVWLTAIFPFAVVFLLPRAAIIFLYAVTASFLRFIYETLVYIWEFTVELINKIWEWIVEQVKTVLKLLMDSIQNIWEETINLIEQIWEKTKDIFH